MRLSVVIPAHNEEGSIRETVSSLHRELADEHIAHEIVVVNDHSTDGTAAELVRLGAEIPELVSVSNEGPGGFGLAVREGFERFSGDCVAVMMADRSDDPKDLVRFYRKMQEGFDCVFGSRFIRGGATEDYPPLKLFLNRLANNLIKTSFGIPYNDVTNAFKLYRRETLEGLKPFLAPHFNLTMELPLKAIVRGYSFAVLPNRWTHRKTGASKLRLKEMGSRYFFIFLYCLIEKFFSRGDYRKAGAKP